MIRTKRTYEVGDIVRHAGRFLRSAGWYTDVPVNGLITAVKPLGDWQLLSVTWSDGEKTRIIGQNVEPCPKAKASREACHAASFRKPPSDAAERQASLARIRGWR